MFAHWLTWVDFNNLVLICVRKSGSKFVICITSLTMGFFHIKFRIISEIFLEGFSLLHKTLKYMIFNN